MPRLQMKVLKEVGKFLSEQAERPFCAQYLESKFNVKYHLIQKEFKYAFGVSIKECHLNFKCKRLISMLKSTNGNIDKTMYAYAIELGYQSESGLQNFTKRRFDLTFNEVRQNVGKIETNICNGLCENKCDNNYEFYCDGD